MLGSNRITLTPLLETDISEEYLESLNDQDYMQYSKNSAFTHTLKSQISYIMNFTKSNHLLFGIKSAEDGKLLGTINCYINFTGMTLNLGFLIFRNHQGKGYTSEALGLLIPYLEVQFPGMQAVIGSNRNNLAMHRVARKLDFQLKSVENHEENLNLHFVRSFSQVNSQFFPIIPDFIFNANTIGVVAYDAGGAEQITWLLRNLPQKTMSYIDGPAQKIFDSSGISFDQVDQLEKIMECDLVITGSGWMSELEKTAIKQAKSRDIPCITVLDHWVNYLERFAPDEDCQPQILAVTNSVALQIAQEKFPNKVVWLLPDFQLENYKEKIQSVEKSPSAILILLEPTSASNSVFAINYDVITSLIESAFSIKRARGLNKVLIRLHHLPSLLTYEILFELSSARYSSWNEVHRWNVPSM